MLIVVALGGNALLRRGERMTAEIQRANVRIAALALAEIHPGNTLVVTHGNGPQVGLLALRAAAYAPADPEPLDVLDAETEGMIGYMIEQELGNALPAGVPLATLLTMVEVDPADPGFANPSKFVGPSYDPATAERLAAEKGWIFKMDGDKPRRVVASPQPRRIVEMQPIRWLLGHGAVVIAAGGGGIPCTVDHAGARHGVEAVIDKDACSHLLAVELAADLLILATDTPAVFLDWGKPAARAIRRASPDGLAAYTFPAGSMGPKIAAACAFTRATGRRSAIGALADLAALIRGEAGTTIHAEGGPLELTPG